MEGQIVYLNRAAINDARWNAAIARSTTPDIYATSRWLDCLSPGWGALILNDYQCVLPLTFKKKYGIRYLVQPDFTQKTGLFADTGRPGDHGQQFLDVMLQQCSYGRISVNWEIDAAKEHRRNNYILPLNKDYGSISAGYQEVLIKNLKKAARQLLYFEEGTDNLLPIRLFENLYGRKLRLKSRSLRGLKDLTSQPPLGAEVFSRLVKDGRGTVLAASLFFKYRGRIYNIISATTPQGRRLEAVRFLYDQLIREFSSQDLILDFEGGNAPGTAFFFRQFGAQLAHYYVVHWNRLSWPLRLFKS
ncbi:hypothetical protein GCM10027051_14670 [Niabella terrae]